MHDYLKKIVENMPETMQDIVMVFGMIAVLLLFSFTLSALVCKLITKGEGHDTDNALKVNLDDDENVPFI